MAVISPTTALEGTFHSSRFSEEGNLNFYVHSTPTAEARSVGETIASGEALIFGWLCKWDEQHETCRPILGGLPLVLLGSSPAKCSLLLHVGDRGIIGRVKTLVEATR